MNVIQMQVDTQQLIVGQQVRVSGTWQAEKPPKRLKIELRWTTEGRGSTNAATVDKLFHDGQHGPIPQAFEALLTVPKAGPVTYDGSLIRVKWVARVSLDMPWARDPSQEIPLQVLPALIDG